MSALTVEDMVLEPEAYSHVRAERRARAIALRRGRRVRLGDVVQLDFENSETLHYQAQEMLYVERVTDPVAAAEEIAVYQRLLPQGTTITATMFIEIDDPERIRDELTRLDGLHDAILLEVGGEVCRARDIPPPDEGPSARTVSVHFLGFDLGGAGLAALQAGKRARILVDHPAYRVFADLEPALVAALLDDLAAA
jgi:hypothetical protein